ncbi:hypothetical protein F5Y09DRAFT_102414 [Xylaria sp. FL1042]|nr:hypothetical protein F5Y09DRAFT_102414 [Xylaria sp. FL1042]
MIRQPFHSALGHTRANLSRVTDGIVVFLRAFSTAQQLAAPPNDNTINGNNSQPTGRRQRAAAAFSDLVEMNNSNPSQPPKAGGTVFKKLDLRSGAGPITVSGTPSSIGGPNIIRGGFPGRGGFARGGVMARGGQGGGLGGLGGGRGRSPGRSGGGGGGGGGGRGGRGRRLRDEEEEDGGPEEITWPPEVLAMREAWEIGSAQPFDPSISLNDLAGWGPAVATANSRVAKDDTVIRQARILGGGQPFHPVNILPADENWKRFTKGNGVFFPNEEMKKFSADAMGLEAFPPVPKETKDAVLQSALLGTYQGPEYAEREDTLGAVRNYVKRDASWNADAERRVEEKVRSLLPPGYARPAKAAGESTAPA